MMIDDPAHLTINVVMHTHARVQAVLKKNVKQAKSTWNLEHSKK